MNEFYEGRYAGEEGLESESNEDLLTVVGGKFSEIRNSITNDSLHDGLEELLGEVENHYDTAANQEDWDDLLKSVQQVLERIEEGDEDAAEAAWEDIKTELDKVKARA
ncbi:MAG: hypothetical protein ACM3NH_04385 [Candidatus Saccharibacteria bacterium]